MAGITSEPIEGLGETMPQSITSQFAPVSGGVLGQVPYPVTANLSSFQPQMANLSQVMLPPAVMTSLGQPSVQKITSVTGTRTATVTSVAIASYPSASASAPTNAAELQALAQQTARDAYLWGLANLDVKWAGLVPWAPGGYDDVIEWFHSDEELSTRVQRGPVDTGVFANGGDGGSGGGGGLWQSSSFGANFTFINTWLISVGGSGASSGGYGRGGSSGGGGSGGSSSITINNIINNITYQTINNPVTNIYNSYNYYSTPPIRTYPPGYPPPYFPNGILGGPADINFPRSTSNNRWYTTDTGRQPTAVATSDISGYIWTLPFVVPFPCLATKIGIYVLGSASPNVGFIIRLGIYARISFGQGGVNEITPGYLVYDSGPLNSTQTGLLDPACNAILAGGELYWLALLCDDPDVSFKGFLAGDALPVMGTSATLDAGDFCGVLRYAFTVGDEDTEFIPNLNGRSFDFLTGVTIVPQVCLKFGPDKPISSGTLVTIQATTLQTRWSMPSPSITVASSGGCSMRTLLGTASSNSASSLNVTNVTVANGDLLVVFAACSGVGAGGISNVDWGGTSLTAVDPVAGVPNVQIWYLPSTGGTHDVTVTYFGTMAVAMTVVSVHGLANNALDQHTYNSNSGGAASSPDSGSTGATTAANEYVAVAVAFGFQDNVVDPTGTWDAGYNNGARAGTSNDSMATPPDDVTLSEGCQDATGTGTFYAKKLSVTNSYWWAAVATFK